MLAIIPGALLSQKFYLFFLFYFIIFVLFCFAFSALYNKIPGMLLSLDCKYCKREKLRYAFINILIYNKIIKQKSNQLLMFRICQASTCYNLR